MGTFISCSQVSADVDCLTHFCHPLTTPASGDPRNIIKTLTGLPETYSGHCEVVVNDRDFDIVARNVILLLMALQFDPDTATPIMLHMWYSALIPAQMLRCLQEKVLPLVQDVCGKFSQSLLMCSSRKRGPSANGHSV
jgi:hypothetical protein